MKLLSWNVAGFRACLKKGFVDFFEEINADIFSLQEVKAEADQFDYRPEGYHMYLNPAERKGYSGVLIYTKIKPISIKYGMNIKQHDHEGRIITLEYDDFYLVNIYTPNAKPDLSRLNYRMIWEDDFLNYLKTLEEDKPVIVCGDLNVAHTEIDLKNPKPNRGKAGFTNEEREKFTQLMNNGFIDTFRYLYPDKIQYSWWSYLRNARASNAGWRIDYFLISETLKSKLKKATIYDEVFGSDHCPVGVEIDI